MSPEYDSITSDNFFKLPLSFFLSIDRRITSVSRVPNVLGEIDHSLGYRLLVDYDKQSYYVRLGLAQNPANGKEVVVIWHNIVNINASPNLEGNYQKLVDWWKKAHPIPLFKIGMEPESKKILLGVDIPSQSISRSSAKNLISRLVEIIPEVEAKAGEISSS